MKKIMNIQTKAGSMEIEISGTKENPSAKFISGMFAGINVAPTLKDGKEKVLVAHTPKGKAIFTTPGAFDEMKQLFSELPEKIWEKKTEIISADGQEIEVERWNDFGFVKDSDGNILNQEQIKNFIENHKIAKTTKSEYLKMWNAEGREALTESKKAGNSFRQAWNIASDGTDKM